VGLLDLTQYFSTITFLKQYASSFSWYHHLTCLALEFTFVALQQHWLSRLYQCLFAFNLATNVFSQQSDVIAVKPFLDLVLAALIPFSSPASRHLSIHVIHIIIPVIVQLKYKQGPAGD